MALDSVGNVCVADTENNRVQAFTPTGTLLGISYGGKTEDKQHSVTFVAPVGVAAVGSGGDAAVCLISRYYLDRDLKNYSLLFFAGFSSNTIIHTGPEFSAPTGIALDDLGYIYVVDAGKFDVEKFQMTVDSDGKVKFNSVAKWGTQGSGSGQFQSPQGIAVDSAANVYVADSQLRCIQVFTSAGTFLEKWPVHGEEPPYGVAVDDWGYVYVTSGRSEVPVDLSYVNDYIEKYTATGIFVSQWGGIGTRNGQCYGPRGVAVDPAGYVYVADTFNDRMQVFAPGPMVSMTSPAPDLTNESPIPVTVTFSRPVTGFTPGGIALGNATVANFAAASAMYYQFDLVPSGQGLVTANIAGGDVNMAAPQFSRTFDTIPPNLPQVTGGAASTNDTTPTWSWISGGGGAGAYCYQLDSEAYAWTATAALAYTPAQPLNDGPHTLFVRERDTAGNWSSSGSFSIIVDSVPPTPDISAPSAASTATKPVTFTVTYLGAKMITLRFADITLNKTGTANASAVVSGAGASSRTVTLAGISGKGTLGISIAAGTAIDVVGNAAGAAGPSATVTVVNPCDIDSQYGVNAVDIQLVTNVALGLDIGDLDADVNHDGQVDAVDIQLVVNSVLGVFP